MHFDDDNLFEWLKYSVNSYRYSDRFQLCLGHTVGGKADGHLTTSEIGQKIAGLKAGVKDSRRPLAKPLASPDRWYGRWYCRW